MKRHFVKYLWTAVILFASLAALLLALSVVFMIMSLFSIFAAESDDFGKRHPIPEGLEYNLPLETGEQLVIDSLETETYLQIWNDSQGGMYLYDFYYGALPAGEIFLRCYETTKNTLLSEDRIARCSKVKVDSTCSFMQLASKQAFTIYEGNWGDYYAARIEVWHRDAATGRVHKLCEKLYRVEGWMR